MSLKIYHNPRCRKSREALQHLEETNQSFDIILYMDNSLSKSVIEQLLKELGYTPEELVRKNEAVWKEHYKGKDLTVDDLITALSENPKLIERPIISDGKNAVIARPLEKMIDFLK